MAREAGRIILGHDDLYNAIHPDLVDIEGPDEGWALQNVPQVLAMREQVVDESNYSQGADLLARMMSEFAVEGSEFQPSQDDDLTRFIAEVLRRDVPDISNEEIIDLLESVQDFPPIDAGEHELGYDERTLNALGGAATRGSFATAA